MTACNARSSAVIRPAGGSPTISWGFFNEFDHWPLGEHLDFASWDSYPIGLVEHFPFEESERLRWQDTSHPDIAPFHHDLYRGVGRGRFWVMEQQPGPVNWARWNPAPARGMVRLWTLEAHAHGAEVVSYFRWRQAPFAQEQMHAGLNLPQRARAFAGRPGGGGGGGATSRGSATCPRTRGLRWRSSTTMRRTGSPRSSRRARISAIRNWSSAGTRRSAVSGSTSISWPPGATLDDYRLVLAPSLPIVSEAAGAGFRRSDRNRRLRPALRLEDPQLFDPRGIAARGRCSASCVRA